MSNIILSLFNMPYLYLLFGLSDTGPFNLTSGKALKSSSVLINKLRFKVLALFISYLYEINLFLKPIFESVFDNNLKALLMH